MPGPAIRVVDRIQDQADADISSPVSTQALVYDGTNWANQTLITGLTEDVSPDSALDYVMSYDTSAGVIKKVLMDNLPGGGGQSNTASNGGTGGIGIVLAKVGSDLPFKSIFAASSKVTVVDGGGNNRVELDVVPANILTSALNNDAGFITATLTQEQVEDFVGGMVGGASVQTLIAVTYDDTNGELDFVVEANLSNYTNDSGFITATLTQEQVEDFAGAMVANGTGTHTGITVTYQDATGDMDFVVDSATDSVAGIVELATIAETNTGTSTALAVTPDGLDGWTGSAQITTAGTVATGTWGADLAADTVDAITEIASGLKSGSDTTLVTGTAGTAANLLEWDANGDAVEASLLANQLFGRFTASTGDVERFTATQLLEEETPAGGDFLIGWESGGGLRKFDVGDLPTGGGGEANTTSNGGTGGIGIVLAKSGIDLPFKSIIAASAKVTVADGGGNNRVEVDLGAVAATDLSTYSSVSGTGSAAIATTITTIADGELLRWNGTNWINNTIAEAGLAAASHTHLEADISNLGTAIALVADNLGVFATTTSAQLLSVVTNATGTGLLVFGTSPTLITPALGTPSSGNLSSCTAYPGDSSLVTTGTVATGTWGADLAADTIDAITEIATALKTGLDVKLVTGTFTTAGFVEWDANGDAVAASIATDRLLGRTTASAGAVEELNIATVTEEASPATGDWILGMIAEGNIRRYNVGNLPGGGGGASTALDNLASVAINTSLISDTDITDDIGTGDIRWRDGFFQTLSSGFTPADTLILRGRDTDGSSWVDILTITSGTTVSATLENITIVTPTIASFASATHDHTNAAGGGQLDHGAAITGLTDDDHTQYTLLLGRSGGQDVIGGTGASDDLTLESTSNATKGSVISKDSHEFQEDAHFGTEISTAHATAISIDLKLANHQTIDLGSASGASVTLTIAPTTGAASCSLLVKQHASSAKDISSITVTGRTIIWLDTEPDWGSDSAATWRVLNVRDDGTRAFLLASGSGS